MGKKILIVDDDSHIREVIRFSLEKAGMTSYEAANGKDALQLFKQYQPDLIVLDITMPEMDGLECCKALRKFSDVPILFLSSRDDEVDRIVGLEIGGDDYVTKPFSPRELVTRVNVILRRTQNNAHKILPEETKLKHGNILVDIESYEVTINNKNIDLTSIEFDVLKTLLSQPNRVFTRNELMDKAYPPNVYVSNRTIDSHIRNIRSKCKNTAGIEVIKTVRGIGYKLGECG